MLPIKSFLWLVECLPGLTPSCWSTIPTTQAPQPLEKPLHMVEATGIVRLWLQIQLPLWKQCCSQGPLQLLGACCPPSRLGELLPQSGGCSWRHCHVHSFFPVQVCPLSSSPKLGHTFPSQEIGIFQGCDRLWLCIKENRSIRGMQYVHTSNGCVGSCLMLCPPPQLSSTARWQMLLPPRQHCVLF